MSKASGVLSHVALVAALLSSPSPAVAQPPPQVTVGGETAIFAAPLALYDPEENAASMLFVSTPLSAAQEASARRDGSWPLDGVGPAVKVTLTFLPGKFSGAVAELDSLLDRHQRVQGRLRRNLGHGGRLPSGLDRRPAATRRHARRSV